MDRLVDKYEGPRDIGMAMRGMKKDIWRYRVGDYRLLCEIQDRKLIVLVLEVRHRREVYR